MVNEFKNTEAYLIKYGTSVVQEIKTRLRSNGKIASGKLYDSISMELRETNTKFTIIFHMDPDYGTFVDKGVEGAETGRAGKGGTSPYKFTNKMPPSRAIEDWMKIKGIPRSASFPIRRHIFNVGITPTNFYTIPTTRRIKELEKGIAKSMAQDAEDILTKQFTKKRKRK